MDQIYLVDPQTKTLTAVCAVSLAAIGMKERGDLESWVLDNPQVLGEELLVITSEFHRFEKSNRRLDVLALDKDGVLVVVELKLELSRSFADQQAIRYAAFCATITMEDVVSARAEYFRSSKEDAAVAIRDFLGVEELPELNDRPRIILAAGSLDDTELTSTVLWLRNFGVDITCVELTPYTMDGGERLILVPRTIIPIPEARDYVISVERKEIKKAEESKNAAQFRSLWRAVGDAFNALDTGFRTTGNSGGAWITVPIGHSRTHYQWTWRKRSKAIHTSFDFEWPERERNLRAAEQIRKHEAEIKHGVDLDFTIGPVGSQFTEARFRIPFDGNVADPGIAKQAAETMKLLIERTYPIVQQILKDEA